MAAREWIESADTHGRAPSSSGPRSTFSSYGDHLLVMAAQEKAAKDTERDQAARAVRRIAGDAAPELLDLLGLTVGQVDETEPHKRCPGCKTRKPHSAFGRNPARSDGCNTYCKACAKQRRKAAR